MSVSRALRAVRPHIFANGGDRKFDTIPEVPVCKEIGCVMVFNVGKGGKMQSSSWLFKNTLTAALFRIHENRLDRLQDDRPVQDRRAVL